MAQEIPPTPSLIQSVTPHPTLIVLQQSLTKSLNSLYKLQEQLATIGGRLVSEERDYVLSQVARLRSLGKWKGSLRADRLKDPELLGQAIAAMEEYALEVKKEGETVMRIKIVVKEVDREDLTARVPKPGPEPPPEEPDLEGEKESEGESGGVQGGAQAAQGNRANHYYGIWVTSSRTAGESEHADSIYTVGRVLLKEAGEVPNDYEGQDPLPAPDSGAVTGWFRDQWENPTTFGHWRTHNGWRCPAPYADLAAFLWMTRNDPPGTIHRIWIEPDAWEPEPWVTGKVDPYMTRADVKARLRDLIAAMDEIFREQKWNPAPVTGLPQDLGLGDQRGL